MNDNLAETTKPRGGSRRTRILVASVVVALAAVAAIVLLVSSGDDAEFENGVPEEVSADELRSFAEAVGHPVYWAGPAPGFKIEATKTADGNAFVRYLPAAVRIGDMKPAYTTIGTYPRDDAFRAARRAARGRGQERRDVPGGGIAVYNTRRPTSVYVAYPNTDYLVEIYATGREAQQLALSGRVGPVR